MVRRLGLGKNNNLTYASLALNPQCVLNEDSNRSVLLQFDQLPARRNFPSLAIQNAPSEDSDQTAQKPRLICIFTGCKS